MLVGVMYRLYYLLVTWCITGVQALYFILSALKFFVVGRAQQY